MTISTIYYVSIIMLFICNPVSSLFKNKKLVACILSCLVLGLLLGLRDPLIVGVDGVRYANTYNALNGRTVTSIFLIKEDKNIFFYFLNWLLSNIGIPYQVFTMISGFFCVSVMGYFVYRFSDMPFLSFMLYMGLGFYTFAFSGQKEAMAMALIMLSYIALHDEKKVTSWILFVLAALSHYTAIVFLPILLIGRIRINKKWLKYMLLVAVPIIIALFYYRIQVANWITSTFAEDYVDRYRITGALGGTTIFAMMATILYVFSISLIGRKATEMESTELLFFERSIMYICISASIVQMFASYAYAFTRLAFYYLQFFTISVPYSLKTYRIKNFFGRYYSIIVNIIKLIIISIMVYMFFVHIKAEQIQEYRFIKERMR